MLRTTGALALFLITLTGAAPASRMPRPPSVTVFEQACPGIGGSCSSSDSDDVYIAPGASRLTRRHEIGHQFDRQVLTDADRAWFLRLFDYPSNTGWDSEQTTEPMQPIGPAETFADAYALCGLRFLRLARRAGMRVYDRRAEVTYMPTIRQHTRACNAIAVIALVRLDHR